MVDIPAILAGLLEKGLGIKISFVDKSTGKQKHVTKSKSKTETISSVEEGFAFNTNGNNNNIVILMNNDKIAPESAAITRALKESFEKKEINYLVEPAKSKIDKYREYESKILKHKVIKTFSGILPERHISLIKTGLYIEILGRDNKQKEINKINTGLERYSSTEKYIVNLASAGHFSQYILPTFNEFKNLTDGLNKFLEHYNKIVNGGELALFVHGSMVSGEVLHNVIEMAKKNLKYGVVRHKIYVHATGLNNVKILNETYGDIKKLFPNTQKKRLARNIPNLILKIDYKTSNLDADI